MVVMKRKIVYIMLLVMCLISLVLTIFNKESTIVGGILPVIVMGVLVFDQRSDKNGLKK